jgi:acyl-CoA synthetase (AMP-forming)/AMP-acid ligase II
VLRAGWLWTGDLARLDEDSILCLAGRARDMLICGGFNIYPQEVEAELAAARGVREVAVIGLPDPDWGEIAVALVAGDGLSESALSAWAKPRLGLRTPKRWVLLDSLPRTPAGKIDKARLKSALVSENGAPAPRPRE